MNYKLQGQEKLYYKNKVSDIMQSYQKQQQEQNKKKQNIKKQIMLSIMQNRQKAQKQIQPSKPTSKQMQVTFKPVLLNNSVMDKQTREQESEKQMKMDTKINKCQYEMKDNKSMNEAKSYKQLFEQKISNLANDRKQTKIDLKSNIYKNDPIEKQDEENQRVIQNENSSLNKIKEFTFKAQNKNLLQDSNFRASHLNKLKERRIKDEQNNQQQIDHPSTYCNQIDSRKFEYKVENEEENLSEQYHSSDQQKHIQRSINNKSLNQTYAKSKNYQVNPYSMPKSKFQDKIQNKQEQNDQQDNQKGVFLTMQQSQSMVASQAPKNYAFQIKNDEEANVDDFQELKKQKIRDIQRKRQERIQQFRRNQSSKKVQIPRGRSSLLKRQDKSQKKQTVPNQSDNYRKNPSNNEMSSKPFKAQFKNEAKHEKQTYKNHKNIDNEFNYNLKNVPVKHIPNNSSNYDPNAIKPSNSYQYIYQDKQPRAISPLRTPKTVLSQNRNKSQNKNVNIFHNDNPNIRQKSSNKVITEPKIQPKDRKNSFTKQSNKKLMINAITHVIFPGQLNRKQRQKLIEILQHSQYEFFVFLFKEYSRKMIKGIYILDAPQKKLQRIYGDKAPFQITAEKVQQFYRFDSGSRQFKKVDGCKSFSLSIHAIDVK